MTNRDLIKDKDALVSSEGIVIKYILDIDKKVNFNPHCGVLNRDLSKRQFVTADNCFHYLFSGKICDAWREFYDVIHNYNDCDNEISRNELAIYNLIMVAFKKVLFKEV